MATSRLGMLVVQLFLDLGLVDARLTGAPASARSSLMRSACVARAEALAGGRPRPLQRLWRAAARSALDAHQVVGEVVGRGQDGDLAGGAARRGDAAAGRALDGGARALEVEVGIGRQQQRSLHRLADQAGSATDHRRVESSPAARRPAASTPGRRRQRACGQAEVVAGAIGCSGIGARSSVVAPAAGQVSRRCGSACRAARRACCRGRSRRPSPARRARTEY